MANQYVNKVVQSNGTTLMDISDTTAVASDVASGKDFYLATGEKVTGTASGGAISITDVPNATGTTAEITGGGTPGPSATAHEIYFEFSDSTNASIIGYWDDSFISDAITATVPTSYNNKTVTLAQLDDVPWYEPTNIPVGVQLVDFTKVKTGYIISQIDGAETVSQWSCCSDYMPIDSSMTFSYTGYEWYYVVFFDANKTFIDASIRIHDDAATISNGYGSGTLTPAKIPSNAAYIRISSYPEQVDDTKLSFIRTA